MDPYTKIPSDLSSTQSIANNYSVNNLDSNQEGTFGIHKASSAENISEQLNQDKNNLLNNTCTLLRYREVKKTQQQGNIVIAFNTIRNIGIVSLLAIVPFIINTVIISPTFAMGIAVSVTLPLVLLLINYILLDTHKCLAIERISLEILLFGIKNHIILPNEISKTDRTQLLAILEDAIFCTVAATDTSELARNIKLHYYASSIDQKELLSDINLKTDFCNFINNIFNNTQLTDYLDTLNVNVDDLKASIYKKIQNTESEELYKYFMWNEPNSYYKGYPVT